MAYKQGSTSGSQFAPGTTLELFDDFISAGAVTLDSTGASIVSQYPWGVGLNVASIISTENGHPGIITIPSAANNNLVMLNSNSAKNTPSFIIGGGAISLTWIFRINTLSDGVNRYKLRIGLNGTFASTFPTNGIFLSYQDNENSGNWICNATAATVNTPVNGGTAVTAAWHNATININAGATSIEFFIDGVSQGTISSGIPTAALSPAFAVTNVAGTKPATTIDLFYMTQTLTTPR